MSRFKKGLDDERYEANATAVGPLATVTQLPVNPLVWDHWHKTDGHRQIDLTRYRDGDAELGFIGRPRLIEELAPDIRTVVHGKSHKTVDKRLGQITKFFRYLTEIERDLGRSIQSCCDLTSADGEGFKRFLLANEGRDLKEKNKTLVAIETLATQVRARAVAKGQIDNAQLLWPSIEADRSPRVHRDVDPAALKAVYVAAKRAFDDSLKQMARGERAIAVGIDPRSTGQVGARGRSDGRPGRARNMSWYNWRNLAVLTRSRLRHRVLTGTDIVRSDIVRVTNTINSIDKRARTAGWRAITAHMLYRFCAPTLSDTMAAYALVSLHTGWMDTVRAITVVDEDFEEWDGWYSDRTGQLSHGQDKRGTVAILAAGGASDTQSDLDDEETVDITSVRPKTGRLHSALSLKNSRYQPFAVIKAQIERTRYLRDLLRERRIALLAEPQTTKIRAEIAAIERKLQSPWLYFHSKAHGGHETIGLLGVSQPVSMAFNTSLKQQAKARAGGHHNEALLRAIDALQPGDIRDGYAAFVYASSGGNIFAVQQALNHRSISVTRHYLRQKRQVAERFKQFRDMSQALFNELDANRAVDPTILRLATSREGLSDEDRSTLEVNRIAAVFRSRYALGCANPLNPPRDIAPNHIEGTLCAVQRCLLCPQARIIREALGPLALRFAELSELRQVIPPARFLTSTLSIELEGIQIIRDHAPGDLGSAFDKKAAEHRIALKTGEALIFEAVQLGVLESELADAAPL